MVSISSTSEEVQRPGQLAAQRLDVLFPLVRLPKKFKDDMCFVVDETTSEVSISSTSEEVQRKILVVVSVDGQSFH